ncbi:hypothetical protein [Dyadobacter sediminis]|uniref:Lipocalin-like domain-containing protein n=1 Tax=Dyadobacter sediminis TaxID=1493691 RepID=A0A5R9K6P2_9BACT|nr:hypothetical protein [Dyadobacter sediminis]TLU89451.1 hypothetical protein FEM55_22180 [Dyadobacter sediminis]GGC05296.1 hypothetical protein GCM10011325_35230 [Dyadobacter sediminis]
MKKASILFIFLFTAVVFKSYSQTAASNDFFAGKWEVSVVGTPNGDSKLVTDLVRKDGKLTGELKDPTGQNPEALPITSIVEEGNKITIYFTAQGTDVSLDLAKVDDTHLKGSVMSGMFDASAVRVKE